MPESFSSSSDNPASSSTHHRRRSSSHIRPLNLSPSSSLSASKGASKAPGLLSAHSLSPIPGTPSVTGNSPMSLSRSPSPRPGGGWSSPGLTTVTAGSSGSSSPRRGYGELSDNGQAYSNGGLDGDHGPNASWMAAKAKSDRVKGYPSFSTRNNGFFSRQRRKISASLPRFRLNSMLDYGEKEKLGRGRWSGPNGSPLLYRIKTLLGSLLRRTRIRLLLLSILLFILWLCFSSRTSGFIFSTIKFDANMLQLSTNHIDGPP